MCWTNMVRFVDGHVGRELGDTRCHDANSQSATQTVQVQDRDGSDLTRVSRESGRFLRDAPCPLQRWGLGSAFRGSPDR
jgi:hypothetical protein